LYLHTGTVSPIAEVNGVLGDQTLGLTVNEQGTLLFISDTAGARLLVATVGAAAAAAGTSSPRAFFVAGMVAPAADVLVPRADAGNAVGNNASLAAPGVGGCTSRMHLSPMLESVCLCEITKLSKRNECLVSTLEALKCDILVFHDFAFPNSACTATPGRSPRFPAAAGCWSPTEPTAACATPWWGCTS
jgi:hypothetical protein